MDATAVARYLKENPAFFEDYADLIAEIFGRTRTAGTRFPLRSGRSSRCARRTPSSRAGCGR